MNRISKIICLVILSIIFIGCETNSVNKKNEATEAIKKAEGDFAKMAADSGISQAFYFFAAPDATIKRQRDTLINGKDAIRDYYQAPGYESAKVSWAPDFVEVSEDGTLGYTYGKYEWESTDSLGNTNKSNGVFHTVWKKQSDGSWKYIWD